MASLISGQFGSRLGRRTGLAATGVAGVVGAAISFAATDYKIMICGKVFTGLVYGFASNFVTSYNAEIAPASLRGVLVSLYQLGICVGHIVAAAINYHCYTLKTSWAWKGPFLSQMVPPAILALGIWFFPESPRKPKTHVSRCMTLTIPCALLTIGWYMIKGRRDDAHRAIRRISGPAYTDDAIIAELDIIEEAIKQEREASHGRSWSQIFEGTNRRRTLLGICLQFLYVYSGPSFITSYGTYFLKVSGVGNAFMVSVILQVMGFVGTLIALPSVAYFRRRSILLAGGASEAICMFAFAIVGTAAPGSLAASKTLAAFTILYYCIVCATWSPLSWVVCCELPSNALRPKTVGAFSGLNWMLTLSMAIWLPYALNPSIGNLGAKVCYLLRSSSLHMTIALIPYFDSSGLSSDLYKLWVLSGSTSFYRRLARVHSKNLMHYSSM